MSTQETLTPEKIKNHVDSLLFKTKTDFPIEVFPSTIQEIIKEANRCNNFPVDYLGTSMLFAVSVAIGNNLKVKTKNRVQTAVVYIAMVGNSGTNKSAPLSFAIKPLNKIDKNNFEKYLKEKKEYENWLSLSKTEKEEQGTAELEKPHWLQFLLSDFTIEALANTHLINKRGIGVYVDELATWFNNFNRYNKGSEEQFWLSNWVPEPIRINRKTTDSIFIETPFISVAGTIQPDILTDLANKHNKRTDNGFLDRILFSYPINTKAEKWNDEEMNENYSNTWESVINTILNLSFENEPKILQLSKEAKEFYKTWFNEVTDKINNSDDNIKAIYPKLQLYVPRLALIIEILKYSCFEIPEITNISVESIKSAVLLAKYFETTAMKVRNHILSIEPLELIANDKKELYNTLPDNFKTNEGVAIANKLGIPERTFKNFLNDKRFFDRIKQGEYEKI